MDRKDLINNVLTTRYLKSTKLCTIENGNELRLNFKKGVFKLWCKTDQGWRELLEVSVRFAASSNKSIENTLNFILDFATGFKNGEYTLNETNGKNAENADII